MPKTRSYHPGTRLLVGLIKITVFLITASYVFVDYVWGSHHHKKSKSGDSHA